MNKKRVGILRGGAGDGYEGSLKRGGELIAFISEKLSDRWQPVDIFIDRSDVWHIGGLSILPSDLMHRVDVVWNTSHSKYSQILKDFSIPHISLGAFSSVLEDSREMLEQHMKSVGVSMPRSILFSVYQKDIDGTMEEYSYKKAREAFEKFPAPWIVRSFALNTNMGVHVAKTFDELSSAIYEGVSKGTSILVEELVYGKVGAVHSVAGFRGEDVYTFPSINFSREENKELAKLSNLLHKHLGVDDYLKSDVVWHPKGGIYIVGISFYPDLRQGSHLDKSLQGVGAEMQHIIDHILQSSL